MAEPLAEPSGAVAVAEPAPGVRRLRLVSANLANGAADAEAFARLVRDVRADVVAVQELGPAQAEALREVLPHGALEGRRDFRGMGVAARAPVHLERVAMPYRDAWVVRLGADAWAVSGAGLEIVNVHIAAPHVRPVPRGLLVRRVQLRALEQYLLDTPVASRVLLGDFNATPLWPVYRRIAAHMTDAALEVAQRRGRRRVERTWARRPGGPRLLRIDHGFLRGVRAEEFQVIPVVRSDHAAILMDVVIDAVPATA